MPVDWVFVIRELPAFTNFGFVDGYVDVDVGTAPFSEHSKTVAKCVLLPA
jgi:hypothetical protein